MVASQQIAGIQANFAALQRVQAQVTGGSKLLAASDNPAVAVQILGTSSSLRALDQYQTSIQRATSRVTSEDTTLQQITDLLTQAKQVAVGQATATATDQSRATAGAEMQQIFEQLTNLGNTKVGNEYLFGGDQSTTKPFDVSGAGATVDYTSTNPQGQRSIAIGEGLTMAPTHDGKQVFLDTGVLNAVRDMTRAMSMGSSTYGQTGIANSITGLDTAFDKIQTLVGETGAKANALATAGENVTALNTNVTTLKSNLQDVDMEAALMELTNRQTAYQAAMLATSKVAGLTLTDYLR